VTRRREVTTNLASDTAMRVSLSLLFALVTYEDPSSEGRFLFLSFVPVTIQRKPCRPAS
jgi:hypothetical protein